MNKKKRKTNKINELLLLSCCIVVSNCSKGNYRQHQYKLADYYKNENTTKAEKLVKKDKFLPEKDNILLKTIEKGTAYYYNQKYCNAIKEFNKAGEIVKEQQTKSIGSGITSTVGVDDGIFYGETFEKSLINFYKSLTNYHIYYRGTCEKIEEPEENEKIDDKKQQDKNKDKQNINSNGEKNLTNVEKQSYLRASRANIIYWDSWINSRIVPDDDKYYIEDVLLKLWGAFIHEQIGGNFELQIAKQLYEDAKRIAKNRYVVYQTFNNQNDNFVKNIADRYKRSKFIEKDNLYIQDIVNYCDSQIKRLQNKIKTNLAIIIHDNTVSLKKVNKKTKSTHTILASASPSVLGMLAVLSILNTTYEEPYIDVYENEYRYFYEIKQNDRVIKKQSLVLSEPISDINYMNLQEKLSGIQTRLFAGLVAKYIAVLTPIAAAYTLAMNSNSSYIQLAATAIAIASYASASYAIEQSAMVDIRQWVSLPANIFIATDSLKPGKYTIKISKRSNQANNISNDADTLQREKIILQKEIEISDKMNFIDIKTV